MATIHPRLAQLLAQQADGAAAGSGLTAADVRIDDLATLDLQTGPVELHAIEDVPIPGSAGLTARLYRPGPGPLATLLYFHGGGFVIDATGYDRPLRELALTTGCLVVAPAVRLAPEHRYPAAVEDAIDAANWAIAEAKTLAGRPGPIAIVGDSSGGNLTAIAARELTRSGVPLSCQVLIYPMLDATASSASYARFASGYGFSREKSLWYFDQYLPADADRHEPRISPLFEPDLSGLPRTLVITAEFDPLRDDGARYAQAITEAGGDATLRCYDGMIHGFFQFTGILETAHDAQADIARWLHDACSA